MSDDVTDALRKARQEDLKLMIKYDIFAIEKKANMSPIYDSEKAESECHVTVRYGECIDATTENGMIWT